MNKRELYQIIERLTNAIRELRGGRDPAEVIDQDLQRALESAEYMMSVDT